MNVSTKRFDRRKLVKSSAALGAAAFGLPTIIKKGAAQDTTLSLWGAGDADPAENDTQMAYVAAVEEATGIKLELRNIPFAQFDNVSQAALAAGEGPDLLMVNSVTVGAFVERGYLQATGDLLAASTMVKQEDFFEGIFTHVVYKDQIYGLPVDTGTRALYYNVAMLDEKGVAPPTTFEELTAALPQLTDASNGVFGLTYSGGERWVWLYEALGMLTVPNGHEFLNDDLTEGTVAARVQPDIQWWVDAHSNGWVAEENASSTDGNDRIVQFSQGRAATSFLGHWARESLIENNAPEFAVMNLKGSQNIGSSTGGWTMMITKDASDPETAWKAMEYTFGTPEVLATLTGLMPATKAANALVLTDEFYAPFKDVLEVNARHPIRLNAALPEMAEILRSECQAAILGAKSVEDAATQIDSQFNEALQTFA
jgi:multiple sugar transport system substrate-binding protein